MPRSFRYPLRPVDNLFLAVHESMRRRGRGGQNSMLLVEAKGDLPADAMREAVRELGRRYPALSAVIGYTPMRRAMWRIPHDADPAAAIVYEHVVVAEEGPAAWEPLRATLNALIDPHHGPQLSMVHVQIGADRHRLGFRCPHHLMDLEGSHLLLLELHAILIGQPPTLGQTPNVRDNLAYRYRFPRSEWRALKGWWLYDRYNRYRPSPIMSDSFGGLPRPGEAARCNLITRQLTAANRRTFETLAKQRCAAGPLLYCRAVMVAIARAYHRIASERGRVGEHYLFSQTIPMERTGPRPGVHGNFVAIPWIVFRPDELSDWKTADATMGRQLAECERRGFAEALWETCRATRRWPLWITRWMAGARMPPGAGCCTAYRFREDMPLLGSARVLNLSGAATVNTPPGWLAGMTTFRDQMTVDISYFEHSLDRTTAERLLDYAIADLLDSSSHVTSDGPKRSATVSAVRDTA